MRNRSGFWFLIIAILFLALRLPFLTKEYAPEEAAWVRGGQGVAASGFPWTYLGEPVKGDWAFWKGPLFPWLLGLGFRVFGEHEVVARGIPLLFAFGQLLLLFALATAVFGKEKGWQIALLASFIITLNPFAIQNAVQVDIDGSLVGFAALLLLLAAWPLFGGGTPSSGAALRLFAAATFIFLIRFDVSVMFFFAIAVFAFLRKERRLGKKLITLFAGAIITAVCIFAIYNALVGEFGKTAEPFLNVLRQLGSTLEKKISSPGTEESGIVSRLAAKFPFIVSIPFAPALLPSLGFLTVTFVWITAPLFLFLLFHLGMLVRSKQLMSKENFFLFLPAFVVCAAFVLIAPAFNYPRYMQTPLLLFSLLAASAMIVSADFNLFRQKTPWSVGLPLLLAMLTAIQIHPFGTMLFEDRVRSNPVLAGAGLILSLCLTAGLIIFAKSTKRSASVSITLLLLTTATAAILVGKDLGKPYSLNAYYGNYGFREAGLFLRNVTRENDVVVTVDTVGYYYGRKYYDINVYDPQRSGQADFVLSYEVPPGRFDKLTQGLRKIAGFGTVAVYALAK